MMVPAEENLVDSAKRNEESRLTPFAENFQILTIRGFQHIDIYSASSAAFSPSPLRSTVTSLLVE
jgi:hypothetical protein